MEESAPEIVGSSPDDDAVPMVAEEPRPERQPTGRPGAIRRFIKISSDPIDPSKIMWRRAPRHPAGSPSVPVMSSPPRPRGPQDQGDWKIPSVVNAWKNPERHSTASLEKRLASVDDHARISRHFAELEAALYAAEKKAREAARIRGVVMTGLVIKAKERREQLLPRHADEAAKMVLDDVLRAMRRKKSKITKVAADREVGGGARVALDTASTGGVAGSTQGEKLLNQAKGTHSVFAANDDHVYSGRPFASESTSHGGDADEQQGKVPEKDRSQPDKGISGAPEKADGKRERPAELDEPPEQEDDPFDLEQFLNKVKKGKDHQ